MVFHYQASTIMANDTASDHWIGCSSQSLDASIFEGLGADSAGCAKASVGPIHFCDAWHIQCCGPATSGYLPNRFLPDKAGGNLWMGDAPGMPPWEAVDLIDEASSLVRSLRNWSPRWLWIRGTPKSSGESSRLSKGQFGNYQISVYIQNHPNWRRHGRLTTEIQLPRLSGEWRFSWIRPAKLGDSPGWTEPSRSRAKANEEVTPGEQSKYPRGAGLVELFG